jgi:hypothetical protein
LQNVCLVTLTLLVEHVQLYTKVWFRCRHAPVHNNNNAASFFLPAMNPAS